MKNANIKHIIILVLSLVLTIILALYITSLDNKEELVVESKKTIVKENKKEYLKMKELSSNLLNEDYKVNLKYYGEVLKNKKVLISVEVYLGEYIKGEYVYNILDNKDNLSLKELLLLNEKNHNSNDAMYITEKYLVLKLSPLEDGNKFLLFDQSEKLIDTLTMNLDNKCMKMKNINDVIFEDGKFKYFQNSLDNAFVEEYEITLSNKGFTKNLINSYDYNSFCLESEE